MNHSSPDVLQIITSYMDLSQLPNFFDKYNINKQFKFKYALKTMSSNRFDQPSNCEVLQFIRKVSPSMTLTHIVLSNMTDTALVQQYISSSPQLVSLTLYKCKLHGLNMQNIQKVTTIESTFDGPIHCPGVTYLKIMYSQYQTIICNLQRLKTFATHYSRIPFSIADATNIRCITYTGMIIRDINALLKHKKLRKCTITGCTIDNGKLSGAIPTLTTFKLTHRKNINDIIHNIIQNIPNVRFLALDSKEMINLTDIQDLLHVRNLTINAPSFTCDTTLNMPHLHTLNFGVANNNNCFSQFQTPNLTTLNLKSCNDALTLSSSYFSPSPSSFRNLQNVTLNDCSFTHINELFNCRRIRKLSITNCNNLTNIGVVYNYKELEYLEIKYCEKLSNIHALHGCTNLRSLVLYWNFDQPTQAHEPLSKLNALSGCHRLETLKIRNSALRNLTGIGLCFKLKTLILMNGAIQNLNGIADMSSIQTLEIHNSYHLVDVGALVGCTNLCSLVLKNCPSLQTIEPLRGCLTMHSLVLEKCPAILDIADINRINPHYLSLVGCSPILDLGIVSNYTNLRHLVLSKGMLMFPSLPSLNGCTVEII